MSKFRIMYEVESYDINSALNLAHTLLFTQEIDADSVKVEPVTTDPGRSFADEAIYVTVKDGEHVVSQKDIEDDKPRFFDKVLGFIRTS